jgi:hypothetical protein
LTGQSPGSMNKKTDTKRDQSHKNVSHTQMCMDFWVVFVLGSRYQGAILLHGKNWYGNSGATVVTTDDHIKSPNITSVCDLEKSSVM